MSNAFSQRQTYITKLSAGILGSLGLPPQVWLFYYIFIWCKWDKQIWGLFENNKGFIELCVFSCLFTVPLGISLGILSISPKNTRKFGSLGVAALAILLLTHSFSVWNESNTLFVFVPITGLTLLWAFTLFLRGEKAR